MVWCKSRPTHDPSISLQKRNHHCEWFITRSHEKSHVNLTHHIALDKTQSYRVAALLYEFYAGSSYLQSLLFSWLTDHPSHFV